MDWWWHGLSKVSESMLLLWKRIDGYKDMKKGSSKQLIAARNMCCVTKMKVVRCFTSITHHCETKDIKMGDNYSVCLILREHSEIFSQPQATLLIILSISAMYLYYIRAVTVMIAQMVQSESKGPVDGDNKWFRGAFVELFKTSTWMVRVGSSFWIRKCSHYNSFERDHTLLPC